MKSMISLKNMKNMNLKKRKRKAIGAPVALLLACLLLMGSASVSMAASAHDGEMITTRSDFINALNEAQPGDVLLVGDIDFNLPYTGAVNVAERLSIDKSITVKSGKADGNAVFKGVSFNLMGSMIAGEASGFTFEGITFDEGLDTDTLTNADWELTYDSLGEPISFYPLQSQYAIECRGNATATFVGCEFKSYMHDYGAAIRAYYGDYTMTPSLEAEHGDNVPCRLTVNLTDCGFDSNAALYGGGAIFLQASGKNVTLNADGCRFTGNRSGFTYNSVGGGAIYTQNAVVNLTDCTFAQNEANYFYGGTRETSDQIRGGAVYASTKSALTMRHCKVSDNKASEGGGIAVTESTALIEDCIVLDNKAIPETENKQSEFGIASNQGLGGAIYLNGVPMVTVGNTEIRGNYAENAFGAIFTNYDLLGDYSTSSVELFFCTVADNVCGTKMTDYTGYGEDRWLWFSYYTDFFDISYLNYYGNLVVDELYETHHPKSEQPTEENGYNFFGSSVPEEWYENGHLLHAPVISTEYVKEKLGDRNYYGTFTVGANNHDVTYRFFADGECQETVTLPSGVAPSLPALQKTGHTLTGWRLAEEIEFEEGRSFVVGNETESVDVHAVFTPNVYKVTFNFGETTTEISQIYGTPLTLPETLDRYGYTFMGWFVSEDGTGEALTDGALFTYAGDITYYAFYEKNFPWATVLVSVFGVMLAGGLAALAFAVFRRKKPVPVIAEPAVTETKELPDTSMLSPREREVLALLLEGKQRTEIAAALYVSENTVKKQITSIYAKLGVSTRNELFALFK